MKNLLDIYDKNKFIYFKNRKIRTPCIIEFFDEDMSKIKLCLKLSDIKIYTITPRDNNKHDNKIIAKNDNEPIIEEL